LARAELPNVKQAPSTDTGAASRQRAQRLLQHRYRNFVLKEGADVQLKFAQDVTSKTATEGDTVNLVLESRPESR